jgi:hypothetical protein
VGHGDDSLGELTCPLPLLPDEETQKRLPVPPSFGAVGDCQQFVQRQFDIVMLIGSDVCAGPEFVNDIMCGGQHGVVERLCSPLSPLLEGDLELRKLRFVDQH